MGSRVVGAIVLSPTDAASQKPVVGSAPRVVVARARALRDAAVQHCLEYLGSRHPGIPRSQEEAYTEAEAIEVRRY